MAEDARRAASAALQRELLAVLEQHSEALGGPVGELHAVVELTGSLAAALIEHVPLPATLRLVDAHIADLALFVAAARAPRH